MGKAYEQRAHQKVKIQRFLNIQKDIQDFPGGPVVKSLPASVGDLGLIPGLGRYHMPRGNEAHALQLAPTRPRAATNIQHSQN